MLFYHLLVLALKGQRFTFFCLAFRGHRKVLDYYLAVLGTECCTGSLGKDWLHSLGLKCLVLLMFNVLGLTILFFTIVATYVKCSKKNG